MWQNTLSLCIPHILHLSVRVGQSENVQQDGYCSWVSEHTYKSLNVHSWVWNWPTIRKSPGHFPHSTPAALENKFGLILYGHLKGPIESMMAQSVLMSLEMNLDFVHLVSTKLNPFLHKQLPLFFWRLDSARCLKHFLKILVKCDTIFLELNQIFLATHL